MKRKICVVTGSRAEYGLLYHTLRQIEASKNLELMLVVTGTHLSPEFGYTVNEIVKDGFKIIDRIELLMSSDSQVGIGKSIGLGIIGFVDCFKRLNPDIILVLGDRFEIFAAVTAAMALNFPVAHISGGDVTEGAIDEQIRHAITKMSHIHFVSLDRHAERVRRMGEEPWRIHIVGEPGIDNIRYMHKLPITRLEKFLGFSLTPPTLLVTFHPVTLQSKETSNQMKNLLTALDKIDSMIIFTYPNADAGGRIIINAIEGFLKSHTNAKAFKSLGSHLYLNLLSQADAIVGNSSSGIVEAASFKIPSVNIGMRQKGRLFPKNVISTSDTATSIMRGIRKALSQDFRKQIEHLKNPYDQGGTAKNIVKVLSCFEIRQKLLLKKFTDH